MIRGSVLVQRRRCGKTSCRRTDGVSLHESTVLSYSEDGRNRTIMLAADQVDPVRAAVDRYRAAQAKLEVAGNARPVFRAGSFAIFTYLLTGWVLAPGRRTVTAMITLADPAGGRAHDAYHRVPTRRRVEPQRPWRLLATHAVTQFAPTAVTSLDCDDTLFHKSGRQAGRRHSEPLSWFRLPVSRPTMPAGRDWPRVARRRC